jgi:hypothetical protein
MQQQFGPPLPPEPAAAQRPAGTGFLGNAGVSAQIMAAPHVGAGGALPDPMTKPREFVDAVVNLISATDKEGYFMVRLCMFCIHVRGGTSGRAAWVHALGRDLAGDMQARSKFDVPHLAGTRRPHVACRCCAAAACMGS